MVAFVCHFFEKKWRKKLPTGRFLAHMAGSAFVLRLLIVFWVVEGADPYKIRAFAQYTHEFGRAGACSRRKKKQI
jgi:hypothetical protein